MNKYRTELFHLDATGEFKTLEGKILEGKTLEDWLQSSAEAGYHLLGPCQPTANESGIWTLATMELDDDDDDA